MRAELGKLLADITNKSMLTTELYSLPQSWRGVNVVRILKRRNRSNPGNYRPVILTYKVCKVMERIIKNHMTKHLMQYSAIQGDRGLRFYYSFLKRCMKSWMQLGQSIW